MNIITFLIILIVAIVLGAVIIITNLLAQIRQLEKIVQDTDQSASNIYMFMLQLFTETLADLQRIDKGGAFASDDEVGYIFRIIKESIEQIKFQLENLEKNDEDME